MELKPIYDTRKSFYKKAYTETQKTPIETSILLYSYGTNVASIIYNYEKETITFNNYGRYSQTTTRHQKEFFRQYGYDLSDAEIKEIFKSGKLEIKMR